MGASAAGAAGRGVEDEDGEQADAEFG